jgi:elongation factor Tu
MAAMDSYIPLPERDIDKDFLMPIEDVFTISGRGTVVTGRVERGKVKVGEEMEIVGIRPTMKKVVTGVEMFRKLLDRGRRGQRGSAAAGHGAQGRGAGPGGGEAGFDHAAQEVPRRGVRADEGGGRAAHAVLPRLPAAVLLPDDGRDGAVNLDEGVEMVIPGDNTNLEVELITADRDGAGLRFAIREGGRTVGAGTITEILE